MAAPDQAPARATLTRAGAVATHIHAEAYAAGELKHGPLALVDADMPVIVVAPNDELLEKLKSNLQEVREVVSISPPLYTLCQYPACGGTDVCYKNAHSYDSVVAESL